MRAGADERAVSETAGVAVLIAITVVATASVGLSVIIVADGGGGTEFSVEFQYSSDLSQLTVFYNGEKPVSAGDIAVDGPENNVTWAELAEIPEDEQVEPGDQPVFLNEASPYGSDVAEDDVIRVVHTPPDGERATATWNEDSSEDEGSNGTEDDETADDPVPSGGVAP